MRVDGASSGKWGAHFPSEHRKLIRTLFRHVCLCRRGHQSDLDFRRNKSSPLAGEPRVPHAKAADMLNRTESAFTRPAVMAGRVSCGRRDGSGYVKSHGDSQRLARFRSMKGLINLIQRECFTNNFGPGKALSCTRQKIDGFPQMSHIVVVNAVYLKQIP